MKSKIYFFLRLAAAIILLQTLFFKFTGAPESIYIFSTLNIEPWGRWLSGVSELIASILVLIPATQALGALLALGIMTGAIMSHFLFLGIIVQDDGGLLFSLACVVFVISVLTLQRNRQQLLNLFNAVRGL
jgi:uncharacterized membrane protein YphA (DoxX/SURF4 family)